MNSIVIIIIGGLTGMQEMLKKESCFHYIENSNILLVDLSLTSILRS